MPSVGWPLPEIRAPAAATDNDCAVRFAAATDLNLGRAVPYLGVDRELTAPAPAFTAAFVEAGSDRIEVTIGGWDRARYRVPRPGP